MNRLSQQAQTLHMHKLMHIYDKNTGKKLTLQALLQNPETTEMWSNLPVMNMAVYFKAINRVSLVQTQ